MHTFWTLMLEHAGKQCSTLRLGSFLFHGKVKGKQLKTHIFLGCPQSRNCRADVRLLPLPPQEQLCVTGQQMTTKTTQASSTPMVHQFLWVQNDNSSQKQILKTPVSAVTKPTW